MAQSLSPVVKVDTTIVDDKKIAINVPINALDAMDLSTKERTRILRKLDWHILPLISLLYLLSFM